MELREASTSNMDTSSSLPPTMTPTIKEHQGPSLTSAPVSGNSPAPAQTGTASVDDGVHFLETPTLPHRNSNVAQNSSTNSNARGINEDEVARQLQLQTPQRTSTVTVEQPASAAAATDSSRPPPPTFGSPDSQRSATATPSPIFQRFRQRILNFSPGSPVQFVEEEELGKKGRKVKKSNPGSSNAKKKGKTSSTPTQTPNRQRRNNDEIEDDQEDERNRLNRRLARNETFNDSGIGGDRSGLQGGDDDGTSEEGTETEDGDDDEGFQLQELSFHYLPVKKVREKISSKTKKSVINLSELELIELIMVDVNLTQQRQKNNDFQQKKEPSSENEMEVENDENRFQCLLYYQKKEQKNPLWVHFKVPDNSLASANNILFYYRKDEIFAGTMGQTWQALQVYCCYDFPCLISGRLTSREGNVEEKSKHIIGIRRSTQSVKKLATSFDQINTITQSFTKHLRPDSSLFWLKEFQPRRKNQNVKLAFGLTLVRIKKVMELDNIPEILEHFSKIRKGQPTLRFGDPEQGEEIQIDEFPAMRVVPSGPEWQQAEARLCEILQKFMHHQDSEVVKKLDLCDKRVEDFYTADEFKVFYGADLIHKFSRCPTVLEVLNSLREKCVKLTDPNVEERTFSNRLKKHLKMTFTRRGKTVERKLLQLIEGEITMDGLEYMKSMGQWWTVRDKYYVEIQEKFLAVLNSQEPKVFEMSSELHLPFMWLDEDVLYPGTNRVARKKMTSVQDYLEQYRNKPGYFFPPETEALEVMSSQALDVSFVNASDSQDSEVEAETKRHQQEIQNLSNNCCDMFRVFRRDDESYDFHLYYIFDRFDSAIRDASTRIAKSLDILFKGEYASSSLLRKVYNYCSGSVANATPTPSTSSCNNFNAFFVSFDVFQQNFLKGNNVTIVAGFLTGPRKVERSKGKITDFVRSSRDEVELPAEEVTLDRERYLERNFNEHNVDTLVLNSLPEQLVEKICSELEIYGPSDEVNFDRLLMATKVRDRLLEKGYCLEKESGEYPLTGKMLKLRSHAGFKLFEDFNVNKELFKLIQRNFLTRLPGFIHKLETIGIFDEVTQKPKLSLKITEIPIEKL